MKYASLVVDNNTNATDGLYTYSYEGELEQGCRVRVGFGIHDRITDAYVAQADIEKPEGVSRIKPILSREPEAALSGEAMQTALWMHRRYMCRYIEAVKCFLPGNTQAKRKTKDPFSELVYEPAGAETLNVGQQAAFDKIAAAIDQKRHEIFLLLGVTGSGKTELYLQAMQRCISVGRQGIILVPEISLTPQTVSRFINRFGPDAAAVLHSRLTPAQRSVEYEKIRSGKVKLVIGARSAVFAPFDNIGLIVLDEEHESSYKSDKSPKYDTAELAAKRAMSHGAAMILGSATPNVTDYYRSCGGVFTRLELKERYNATPLPLTRIVDMRKEIRAGNKSLFSETLKKEIDSCLSEKKQVILFLNRRGYSSFVSCRECGYTVKCPECGIAMVYHKEYGELSCHYCGRRSPVPSSCPKCGSRIIGKFGAGTEQLEEKTAELFPGAAIDRLDMDSVKRKGSLESILKRFGSGKTDILIGTQLVAKGLDFRNVGLVGIVNADVTFNIPDYRSSERGFQLITQAAGRSGRGDQRGKVIIQSYVPDHPALIAAARQDYEEFYRREIQMRRLIAYPPFADLFQIVLSCSDQNAAESEARLFAGSLSGRLPENCIVLGPSQAPINIMQGQYRYQLIIKVPHDCRAAVCTVINAQRKIWKGKSLITVDINPYSML